MSDIHLGYLELRNGEPVLFDCDLPKTQQAALEQAISGDADLMEYLTARLTETQADRDCVAEHAAREEGVIR